MHTKIASLAMVLLCIQITPSFAELTQMPNSMPDPMIEGAKLCTRHLQRYEREQGIPAHLLSAIATTESGRYSKTLKMSLPWPWTINAEGKAYYLDSKEEAMATAHKLYDRGVRSMDVGCMQVNLHHHPRAFSSLSQAFEPETNIAYAASFLKELYQEEGSWKQAAGDYHSKTRQLGNKYVGLVYNSWYKIVDKLRTAKLNVPSSSVSGLQDMKQASMSQPTLASSAPSLAPQALSQPSLAQPNQVTLATQPKTIHIPSQPAKEIAAYRTPQAKTISVNNNGVISQNTGRSNYIKKRNNGVIVVHPDIKVVDDSSVTIVNKNAPPEPMVIADATPALTADVFTQSSQAQSAVPQPTAQAKIIRIDNQLANSKRNINSESEKKSGPNFIFND